MFELKPLPESGIPAALERARHYRSLNEPRQAESICRDVLRTDAENQDALVTMLLALTDQFGQAMRVNARHAEELLPRLTDDYRKAYYAGIICERWAKAQLKQQTPGHVVLDWLRKAMDHYEVAEGLVDASDPDPILRFNACARIVKRNDQLRPRAEDENLDALMQDDVPK